MQIKQTYKPYTLVGPIVTRTPCCTAPRQLTIYIKVSIINGRGPEAQEIREKYDLQ